MQLNEILEENSIKTISQKTKISESNLEAILAGNFESLQKTKALGFIAIIEREYHADLSAMREEALEYYSIHKENNSYSTTHHYLDDEKKGKSKLVILLVIGLFVYATWYFLTQYDKKNLSGLIPFIDEKTIGNFVNDEEVSTEDAAADLSIVKVTENADVEITEKVEEETNSQNVSNLVESLVEETETVEETNSQEDLAETLQSVSIVPVRKLWFGLVNMENNEREHFSIDKAHTVDVGQKSWLVATSSAPFSLQGGDKREDFSDAKEHYFKIDKNGIEVLSKSEYVEQGGWHRW